MLSKTSRKDAAKDKLSDAVQPQLTKATKSARKAAEKTSAALADAATAAEPHLAKARKAAAQAAHEAKAAGDQAYAALPEQARTTVQLAVPAMAAKPRKKGRLFIAFGLLAGAGAVALFRGGKKKAAGSTSSGEFPKIERRDALAAEAVDDGPAPVSTADDVVGETEQQVDAAVSGTRRGRHAARE